MYVTGMYMYSTCICTNINNVIVIIHVHVLWTFGTVSPSELKCVLFYCTEPSSSPDVSLLPRPQRVGSSRCTGVRSVSREGVMTTLSDMSLLDDTPPRLNTAVSHT